MKLATTISDFREYTNSHSEAVEMIKKSGFKYIDYSFGWDLKHSNGIFGKDPGKHIEDMKRLADKLEIEFVQSHSPMGTPIIKDGNYRPFIDATNKCIEACEKLGIKNIVVHSGYEKGISIEENFERNKEFYFELFGTAEKCGVNVLTENFNKMLDPEIFWIDNATDMRNLIDFVDHPLFHCCWDIGHANLHDIPQEEELKILGEHVYALHVQDNFGNDDHHIAPYFGSTSYDDVMQGLKAIEYNGYFTFESDSMLHPLYRRRRCEKDSRLFLAPIDIKIKAESLLYDIGKHILTSYDCFED